jgi:ech hydrogenase subunit A
VNKNGLLHKTAVFFEFATLLLGTVWAIHQGSAVYQPLGKMSSVFSYFFIVGIISMITGATYWGWRWKDWRFSGLMLIQGFVFAAFLWKTNGSEISGTFVLDHLSALTLLLINAVGAIVLIFSLRFLKAYNHNSFKKNDHSRYFAIVSMLMGAMNGLVLSNHLLWILFFLQVALLAVSLLVAHERTQVAVWNARQLARTCLVGMLTFLCGIYLAFTTTGTLLLADLLLFKDAVQLLPPFACVVVAGLAFAGQFPFQHAFLKTATAPAPVAALLQSSAIVTAGIYLILRVSPILANTFGAKMLAIIGAFSFFAATFVAVTKNEGKVVLTLMTVSNSGLVIALASFSDLQAIYAASLLLVIHGLFKAMLLLCVEVHSPSRIPGLLVLLGGLSMFMPPFAMPVAQWTAIESSVRNPAALSLLLTGSIFSMVGWALFFGKSILRIHADGMEPKWHFVAYWPQLVLAILGLLLSVFIVPLTNFFVKPILKENYGRFGDIAQQNIDSFSIQNFSGIDPGLFLGAVLTITALGWLGIVFLTKAPAPVMLPDAEDSAEQTVEALAEAMSEPVSAAASDASMEEETIQPEMFAEFEATQAAIPASIAPQYSSFFARFLDEQKTYRYANVFAAALIILMLEVIFR